MDQRNVLIIRISMNMAKKISIEFEKFKNGKKEGKANYNYQMECMIFDFIQNVHRFEFKEFNLRSMQAEVFV